ncbi:hypothetical protein [Deinococcus koreensis]|uniref:Uncharacterized protein n=1 Tax=Deinococcus koreensis TaxID=2054903 RepID=A0A2K3URN6_9DEIO|nr:hypothetical protein [Deinococcus koreensis]PNY79188.1 hypothetical protein CVO96_20530 [Deinococcus koreensis]
MRTPTILLSVALVALALWNVKLTLDVREARAIAVNAVRSMPEATDLSDIESRLDAIESEISDMADRLFETESSVVTSGLAYVDLDSLENRIQSLESGF